ncbi:hypothetical protein [Prevotella disiens]|nr:hypothetical protein [Prevotella disiens]
MNSSFLYHAWWIYNLECSREEYKGNTIFLYTHSKKPQTKCPKCGNCRSANKDQIFEADN